MTQREQRPKVLITAAGGAGTIEVLRALRSLSKYSLVACDALESACGFAFADAGYVVPLSADPAFASVFRNILQREKPDFIIPLVDEEIAIVHELARAYPHTRVVGPSLQFCHDMLDKWTMYRVFSKHGLPVARTWLASDAADTSYPAIIKPRVGRGSRGFAHLEAPDHLKRYLAACEQPASEFIVQERLDGREFTTSVVVALGGPTLTVVPKEAVAKHGITQIGVTRAVPNITELGHAIQERLRADGPFNMQLMLDTDGIPHVFEVNPRYSTTVALTLAAGVNEVDIVLRRALGETVDAPNFEPDLMMIRYTTQLYVKEAEWKPVDATKLGS